MRIGILIVAYNAASTLAHVLDRIPAEFRARVDEVLICDDHSQDSTYLVGLGYQQLAHDLPITVIRHPHNLGYGGNQKAGYRWAVEHGLDIIVLLHGDGQYAPEILGDIVAPLERGECDAVLGSRMMEPGAARKGGMPAYKYLGNRILTRMENALVGTRLSEWHSGYRAYRVDALASVPFESNSDGFDFDTQVIIQFLEAGKKIGEVPIPTYYGDEICYVDGLRYARDVTGDVLRYRAHKMGFGTGETAFASHAYEYKQGEDTSHSIVLSWMEREPAGRVLDLGCSDGSLALRLRKLGHHVTGVDSTEIAGVGDATDEFVQADLDAGLPPELVGPFDVVVAADVLEHVRSPETLLAQVRARLSPGGWVLVSIPNFVHWYPRLRIALGLFDYDRRGILDSGHFRFFTRRSFERLARAQGFAIRRHQAVGLPLEVLGRGGDNHHDAWPGRGSDRALGMAVRLGRLLVTLRPNLFAYQYVMRLEPLDQT
ncbi:MAG: methyltransferase domain-containing protein [Acidimicrobiales bacterium]